MSDQIDRLLKATESLAYHRQKLAACEAEMAELGPAVNQVLLDVAGRFMVDAAGQPVDGGVYWYSRQAIVRVGDVITIIPMTAMDEKKVFEPEALEQPVDEVARRGQANGHGKPVIDFVAEMKMEDALTDEEEEESSIAFILESGLVIYHAYHDDCISENWYTVELGNCDVDMDNDSGTQFDVRDIAAVAGMDFETPAEAMNHAVKAGWLTEAGLKVPQESDAAGL